MIAAGAALRKSFLNRRQRSRTRHLGRISEPPRPSVMDDPDSWLPSRDSNPDQRLQRPVCYRYTTRQWETLEARRQRLA